MSVPISRPGARASSACSRTAASSSTATLAGQAYARHGTTIDTRLMVIDRIPAEDPPRLSALARHGPRMLPTCWIGWRALVSPRPPVTGASPMGRPCRVSGPRGSCRGRRPSLPQLGLVQTAPAPAPDFVELAYETRDWGTPAHPLRLNNEPL